MGKTNSKLKKKHRTRSMAWNFRFPSITSLSTRRKNAGRTNTSTLAISQWLEILNLNEYESAFEKFSNIDDVMKYTDRDLHDLGVKNEAHRFQMISSLVAVKAKSERGARGSGVSTNAIDKRHSLAVEPAMLMSRSAIEPVTQIIQKLDQSKSLSDIKMEMASPDCDSDSANLKKMLEWELSLDGRDLRSHAWYHGSVSRVKAEEIVAERDGDFLVRDCSSQPGNYVLTLRSKGQILHFVINKIILQPDTVYESVQYRFEEDGFDTVPDLITYYVGSGKSITAASSAKIQNPRNRTHPLSLCGGYKSETSGGPSPNGSWRSPAPSPPVARRNSRRPSRHRLPSVGTAIDGSPVSSSACTFSNSLPRRSFSSKMTAATTATVSSPTPTAAAPTTATLPNHRKMSRSDSRRSEASPSPCTPPPPHAATPSVETKNSFHELTATDSFEGDDGGSGVGGGGGGGGSGNETPPPKPSRFVRQLCVHDELTLTPKGRTRTNSVYAPSGSDSGNGSGDSVHSCSYSNNGGTTAAAGSFELTEQQSSWSTLQRRSSAGVVIKHPKYCNGNGPISNPSKGVTGAGARAGMELEPTNVDDGSLRAFASSMPYLPSAFDLETYHTLLLPMTENKPLDIDTLQGIYALLMESGSRILANHLTRADLRLTIANLGQQYEGCMCKTGIELAMLPHGRQHRLDLIERTECLKLLVATTILTCATESERAELLNKWIEVAIDAKTALGNLFGFCAIMLGLCTPQVQRLDETWHILRQKYTDSAFNFEAKLRPTLKSMNESTNPLAPNTTIPHVLPLLLLYEGGAIDKVTDESHPHRPTSLYSTIDQWESSTADLGLGTWYAHLNSSRQFCRSLATFRRNAEIVLADSKIDDLLLDMFRTEFHLKFLWGSKGAMVGAADRHLKFEEILNAMSEKCENLYPDLVSRSDPADGGCSETTLV